MTIGLINDNYNGSEKSKMIMIIITIKNNITTIEVKARRRTMTTAFWPFSFQRELRSCFRISVSVFQNSELISNRIGSLTGAFSLPNLARMVMQNTK